MGDDKKRLPIIYNTQLEEICLGHIGVILNGMCEKCKTDEKNKMCPEYKPVKIHVFEVVVNQALKEGYSHPIAQQETLGLGI